MSHIEFLNVDLDIESNDDISLLVREIGSRATVMRNDNDSGKRFASFETVYLEENKIITEYKSIIKSLSPEARDQWENCYRKVFDFGYTSGDKPNDFHSIISKESVSSIDGLGGEIVITIYPVNQ